MNIFIITWCKDAESLYGNLLTINSVRVGFPAAIVKVIDNGSTIPIPTTFPLLHIPEGQHEDIIRSLINLEKEPFIILDPDLVFHKEFVLPETNMTMSGYAHLMAGRLLPAFHCPHSQTMTYARLHTSFIYVPKPVELKHLIHETEVKYWECDLIRPKMFYDTCWRRYDTLGQFYSVFPDRCTVFTEIQLDCYDHLFCGTHLRYIQNVPELQKYHLTAQNNPGNIKGIWKEQDEFFKSLA